MNIDLAKLVADIKGAALADKHNKIEKKKFQRKTANYLKGKGIMDLTSKEFRSFLAWTKDNRPTLLPSGGTTGLCSLRAHLRGKLHMTKIREADGSIREWTMEDQEHLVEALLRRYSKACPAAIAKIPGDSDQCQDVSTSKKTEKTSILNSVTDNLKSLASGLFGLKAEP